MTVKAVVKIDGKVALLRKKSGAWDLPGGGIARGETPEQALRREVREELHMDVQIDHLISAFFIVNRHGKTNFCTTFLCHPVGDGQPAVGHEHSEMLLADPNDLPRHDLPIQYADAIGRAHGRPPMELPPRPQKRKKDDI